MSVAKIVRIDAVEPHPHPDGKQMSVIRVGDLQAVSQNVGERLDQPRYKAGELLTIMLKNAILPEDLLRTGFWDPERIAKDGSKGAGSLPKDGDGRKGARVADKRFHNFNSQFITFPVFFDHEHEQHYVERPDGARLVVVEGSDVTEFFGVTEFRP